ncbi:MAG: CDGSH iron-sulfur domain-containing protein [candidate division Zixibacteria bacterium]|nr:CDGSH iron-sulfur domain-containing protein [candidate division Zixibacteria bacterium]
MTEPVIAQKAPYVREEKAGRIEWCHCGRSKNQPYCDGSHEVTDIRPIVVDLTEDRVVKWCGCQHSGNKPFCDGTHKRL